MPDLEKIRVELGHVLSKYKVDKMCDMNPRTFNKFKDFTAYMHLERSVRYKHTPFLYLIQFCLGIIGANVLYFIKSIKGQKKDCKNVEYIFIPCEGKFERFGRVPEIMKGYNYLIMYLPAFKIQALLKNRSFFSKRHLRISTPKFSILSVVSLLKFMLINFSSVDRLMRELKQSNTLHDIGNYVFVYICKYIIYKKEAERLFRIISDSKESKIWFFDNELSPQYISFIDQVRKYRPQDKTVHIQHGMFWNTKTSYQNPLSDFMFTCSKREQAVLTASADSSVKIFAVGAPLQGFNKQAEASNRHTGKLGHIDVLVLATITSHDGWFKLQRELLVFLEKESYNYSVRLRPGTKEYDRGKLADVLKDERISDCGSLSDDIDRAGVIISFSIDALIECFRGQKKTALFITPADYNQLKFIGENLDFNEFSVGMDLNFIRSFLESDYNTGYSTETMRFILDNFGQTDFEVLKQNYLAAIKNIKSL